MRRQMDNFVLLLKIQPQQPLILLHKNLVQMNGVNGLPSTMSHESTTADRFWFL
jgi:hypothetical protein